MYVCLIELALHYNSVMVIRHIDVNERFPPFSAFMMFSVWNLRVIIMECVAKESVNVILLGLERTVANSIVP